MHKLLTPEPTRPKAFDLAGAGASIVKAQNYLSTAKPIQLNLQQIEENYDEGPSLYEPQDLQAFLNEDNQTGERPYSKLLLI